MSKNLQRIYIEGYKSIQLADVDIKNINILIGANGSGKSNFISVFSFLRNVIEQRLQSVVREKGGADRLFFLGGKNTEEIKISLDFQPNYYNLILKPTLTDSLFIEAEHTGFQSAQYTNPYWELISAGANESNLKKAAKSEKISKYVYDTLFNWRVYHLHDTSDSAKAKKTAQINDNLYFKEDASNLASFLFLMQEAYSSHYDRIEKTIALVVPMFSEFVLRPDPLNPETIRLEWLSKNSDHIFSASDLSDGSLRFICLCVLLLQPQPYRPDLILLDEPELGLHPSAIQILGGLLKKTAHFSQLIVSTQSADLVSCFEPEDIIVVKNDEGKSSFERLAEEELKDWLTEYSLGEIWEKNIIGGRP